MMDEEEEFFWGTPRQSYPSRDLNTGKDREATSSPFNSQSSPASERDLKESRDSKDSRDARDVGKDNSTGTGAGAGGAGAAAAAAAAAAGGSGGGGAKEGGKDDGSDFLQDSAESARGKSPDLASSPPPSQLTLDLAAEERIGQAMLERLKALRQTDLWGAVSNLPISNLITEQEFKSLRPAPAPTRGPAAPMHAGPVVTLPPQPRNPHIVNRETPVPPNFAKCVRNKFVFRAFRDFLDKQQASENIRAWQEIEEWRVMKPDPPMDQKRAKELMKKFFVVGAIQEVNIPYDIRTEMQAELRSAKVNLTPLTTHFFDNAAREIERTLADELCPQFLKSAAYKQLKAPAN